MKCNNEGKDVEDKLVCKKRKKKKKKNSQHRKSKQLHTVEKTSHWRRQVDRSFFFFLRFFNNVSKCPILQ